jgi:hypothetical protein
MTQLTDLTELLQISLDEERITEKQTLPVSDTGIIGFIRVSTQEESHGPRLKYYYPKAGKDQPSISISIPDPIRVVAQSKQPPPMSSQTFSDISKFILLNRGKLLEYWNTGTSLDRHQATLFFNGFKSVNPKE